MISIGGLHRCALTGMAALAAFAVMGGSSLLFAAGGALIGAMIVFNGQLDEIVRSKRRVRGVHALTILILVFAALTFPTSRIDAVLIVVMLGIFNRYLLRGGHRDDFLIVGASSVLLAAATTITPGILFLFILVGFVPLLLWALWTSMILGTIEDERRHRGGTAASTRGLAKRAVPERALFIALSGLGLALAGFLVVSLLPRYRFGQMLGAGYFMALPGASSTMELRTQGVAAIGEASVVLRVEPMPGRSNDRTLGQLYARVFVLDRFDGRQFTASSQGALFPVGLSANALPEGRDSPEFVPEDSPDTVRVTMNRLTKDAAFHPIATFGRDGPSELVRKHLSQTVSGTWTSGGFVGTTLTYKARLGRPYRQPVLVGGGERSFPSYLKDQVEKTLTEVPVTVDPRVIELGKRLTKGLATTGEKVNAVLAHLSNGFSYSLSPLAGTSNDPLARFLFEAKRGHCELYAGALAVLLRIGGVKTRVATGYYGGKWNGLGGYLAFTQQDAHAWVEVFYEGEGWRWIDATPEDLRAVRPKEALAFLRDWYDAAEAFWFDNVIDFDERKRKLLVSRISRPFEQLGASLSSLIPDLEAEETPPGARGRGRVVGGIALLAVALGVLGICIPVALWARGKRRSTEVIGRRLRLLLGAKRGENVTLGVLVARLPDGLRREGSECVALYEMLRFGKPEEAPSEKVVTRAIRRLEQTRRELRRSG